MREGSKTRGISRKRKTAGKKSLVLLFALVLVMGSVIGGTLAWLLDKTEDVKNTFTTSDISITLSETNPENDNDPQHNFYKMIPGWAIDKDPKVTVLGGSEDCWLFVKVDASANVDEYLLYNILLDDSTTPDTVEGWTQGTQTTEHEGNGVPTNVYFRKVTASDDDQVFGVLAEGSYEGYSWEDDQVLVSPEVTKQMMDAIDGVVEGASDEEKAEEMSREELASRPTLTFTAYAAQYYKSNPDANASTDEFTAEEAWEILNPPAP